MIVVLADDLTGAAEVGGIASRYGLAVEVQTGFTPDIDADVIVVDTDTRSLPAREAYSRIAEIAQQSRNFTIFKKVDSVLRGHVLAELAALLETLDQSHALLVPANPNLNRTIEGGLYLIDGQPLHQTDFANDPEYPVNTAEVEQILRRRDDTGLAAQWPIHTISLGSAMPDKGIFIGDVAGEVDLKRWANNLAGKSVPAGAAEFFGAFLSAHGYRPQKSSKQFFVQGAALFVCGSTSASARLFCQKCETAGIPVLRMPLELFSSTPQVAHLIQQWVVLVIQALEHHTRVVMAIDRPVRQDAGLPQTLTNYLGMAVERILAGVPIDHLFIEGGATAAALIKRLNWPHLRVKHEFAPGVVCLQIVGKHRPLLTMKPGSYIWPDEIE